MILWSSAKRIRMLKQPPSEHLLMETLGSLFLTVPWFAPPLHRRHSSPVAFGHNHSLDWERVAYYPLVQQTLRAARLMTDLASSPFLMSSVSNAFVEERPSTLSYAEPSWNALSTYPKAPFDNPDPIDRALAPCGCCNKPQKKIKVTSKNKGTNMPTDQAM
jgi:hypothetical protein